MKWLLGLALVICLPLQAAEVKRGYPASYELARVGPQGEQVQKVLASGEALLLAGERVLVTGPAGSDEARISFRLQLTPPENGADRGKMVLQSRVELATSRGRTRLQAGNDPESYIEGPKVAKGRYSFESWRRLGDPTPIVVPFSHDGDRYRLTVIVDPVYTGG